MKTSKRKPAWFTRSSESWFYPSDGCFFRIHFGMILYKYTASTDLRWQQFPEQHNPFGPRTRALAKRSILATKAFAVCYPGLHVHHCSTEPRLQNLPGFWGVSSNWARPSAAIPSYCSAPWQANSSLCPEKIQSLVQQPLKVLPQTVFQ